MIRQARPGDTVLVKSREMTSRTAVVAGGDGVKTTENKIHWSRCHTPSLFSVKISRQTIGLNHSQLLNKLKILRLVQYEY